MNGSPLKQPSPDNYLDLEDNKEEQQHPGVVYEHHRNTITMQQTKVIGEFNYSFVSVSPTYAFSI
jgi:hypothetical protein